MGVNEIYAVVVEAARHIGPVGAASAVMTGAASAAGKSAFDAVKVWFVDKFGSDAPVAQQMTALQASPDDLALQHQLLSSLQATTAHLNDLSLTSAFQQLEQFVGMANNSIGGVQVGSQHADKIVNIGSVSNLQL
ncbi:MAG: hypothetical protein M0Q22_06120 [Sulfuritalea sp.]|nr:hypothetical protein [Sulfuritalea sp.]